MPRTQRFVQYVQQLAYETLWQQEERDERPEDALKQSSTRGPDYSGWNPTAFASYSPFRSPTSN